MGGEWPQIPTRAAWLVPLLDQPWLTVSMCAENTDSTETMRALPSQINKATIAVATSKHRNPVKQRRLDALDEPQAKLTDGAAPTEAQLLVVVSAATLRELDKRTELVTTRCPPPSIAPLDGRHLEALLATLPFGDGGLRLRPRVRTTTAEIGGVSPVMTPRPVLLSKVPVGRDTYSGAAFRYDPFEAYEERLLLGCG